MRKFSQPVSMQCTQEQFEKDLRKHLEEMGYEVGIHKHGENTPMVVNWMDLILQTWVTDKDIEDVCYIEKYNPQFFLALAAQSEGDEFWLGEWLFCNKTSNMGELIRGSIYKVEKVGNGITHVINSFKREEACSNMFFRKATLEELVAHFSKPSVEVEKEWEEAWTPTIGEEILAGDDVDFQKGIYVGKDDSLFVIREEDGRYSGWSYAKPIESITLTRQEAADLLSQFQGKTVLIKD